jgi:hypothetical protein
MSVLESYKVNGFTINGSNISNVYNLGPLLIYAVDIFVSSRSKSAIDWLLTTNSDSSSRIKIKLDGISEYEIKSGSAGESFSNPISYNRAEDVGNAQKLLPSHNSKYEQLIPFMGGSESSSKGTSWSSLLQRSSTEIDKALKMLTVKNDNPLRVTVVINENTDFETLNNIMKDITITVVPSTMKSLQKDYLHFDDEDESPVTVEKGVRY